MKNLKPIPKEPQKIPYTAETFPENALWLREKNNYVGVKNLIQGVRIDKIILGVCDDIYFDEFEDYEIGCQVIKNGKIEIEWKPFYQLK